MFRPLAKGDPSGRNFDDVFQSVVSDIAGVTQYVETNPSGLGDSALIQAALNSVATIVAPGARGVVALRPGVTYKIDTRLDIPSNVLLDARGATLDCSTTTKTSGERIGIRAAGSAGASINLATDAVKGAYSIDLVDASSIQAGDWLLLATQGVNFYPYGGGVNVDRGEQKKVFSVVGNTVTFENSIYDNYTVANAAFVKEITHVENVEVRNARILGSNTPNDQGVGVEFLYTNGFRIKDCEFENIDVYNVNLDSSIRGEVTGCRIRGVYYDSITGVIFYGVAVLNSSQWIRVMDNHGERLRHLYINSSDSSGQNRWGCPRFVGVVGNVAENMEVNAGGASWAFEHHGFGESINIIGNVIDGCYGGFVVRGPGVRFEDNIITGWRQRAIEIHDDILDARDISIKNNTVKAMASGAAAGQTFAVYAGLVGALTTGVVQNVVISHNEIEIQNTTAQGMAMQILGTGTAPSLHIDDNTITHIAGPTVNYPVAITPGHCKVRRNHLINTGFGIRSLGPDQVIEGNEIWNSGLSAGTVGIYTAQLNTRVWRNHAYNCTVGMRLDTGATGSEMIGNEVGGSTTSANAFSVNEPLANVTVRNNVNRADTSALVAAATLTFPTGNNEFYTISGNTNITAIALTAAYVGRRITLKFTGTPTVSNTATVLLQGAANFVATANDMLTLVSDGATWNEAGRSVN